MRTWNRCETLHSASAAPTSRPSQRAVSGAGRGGGSGRRRGGRRGMRARGARRKVRGGVGARLLLLRSTHARSAFEASTKQRRREKRKGSSLCWIQLDLMDRNIFCHILLFLFQVIISALQRQSLIKMSGTILQQQTMVIVLKYILMEF